MSPNAQSEYLQMARSAEGRCVNLFWRQAAFIKCLPAAHYETGVVTYVSALLTMATSLETDLILCVAVVMTLRARILSVLNGAAVSESYSYQQHERRQQQSSISFLGHVSLRKGTVEGGRLTIRRGVQPVNILTNVCKSKVEMSPICAGCETRFGMAG